MHSWIKVTVPLFSLVFVVAGFADAEVVGSCNDVCASSCSLVDPGMGTCIQTQGASCRLAADITCDADDKGVRAVQSRDLNLRGFDITCVDSSCPAAIVTLDPGSVVKSTLGGGDPSEADDPQTPEDESEALVSGPFAYGANCSSQTGSKVSGIGFTGALISILECDVVVDNVIRGSAISFYGVNIGIQSSATSSASGADKIQNNYISNRVWPIVLQGTATDVIDDNVIQTTDTSWQAFRVTGGVDGRIENNAVFGTGSTLFAPEIVGLVDGSAPDLIIQNNVCDELHPDCQDCMDAGDCVDPFAPF